jgi:hypothetical protein
MAAVASWHEHHGIGRKPMNARPRLIAHVAAESGDTSAFHRRTAIRATSTLVRRLGCAADQALTLRNAHSLLTIPQRT